MYTYNLFVFGHDLSVDKVLCEQIDEMDFDFEPHGHDDTKCRLAREYHGGALSNPVVCGIQIASSDGNKGYLGQVRTAKEETYVFDYTLFVEDLIKEVENYKTMWIDEEPDVVLLAHNLTTFLRNHKPGFYSVEVSS